VWGVVLILNKTGVYAIDFPERARRNIGIKTGCLLERSSSSMKLSACFDLQGGPYEITKFLPSRGRKKLTVFSPAVVSGPPPTPGAGGIPVFVRSSCFLGSGMHRRFYRKH